MCMDLRDSSLFGHYLTNFLRFRPNGSPERSDICESVRHHNDISECSTTTTNTEDYVSCITDNSRRTNHPGTKPLLLASASSSSATTHVPGSKQSTARSDDTFDRLTGYINVCQCVFFFCCIFQILLLWICLDCVLE